MSLPLTRRQKEIFDFVMAFRREQGISPTHREICEAFGYSSYGTVHKHLRLLREKGYLDRQLHQKRGLALAPHARRLLHPEGSGEEGLAHLPYHGRIAAGRPIEAVPGEEQLAVPYHLLGDSKAEHYVLEVVGDSMIEEGIHEGDFVVVARREVAEVGEMVVALVESEATLKRFFPEGDKVRLQPANPAMKALVVPASTVRVQGVVVGLMRRF